MINPASYFALKHLRDDLIEWHDFDLNARREELQRKKRGGQFARHCDLFLFTSLCVSARVATIIGPYPSPTLPPLGSRA